MKYRDYTITYNPKPIPTKAHDWDFVHDDYDGAPEHSEGSPSDHRCGAEVSIEACIDAIDELYLDEAEHEDCERCNPDPLSHVEDSEAFEESKGSS